MSYKHLTILERAKIETPLQLGYSIRKIALYEELPKGAIQSATTDRGKEFSCYKDLEKDLNIQVYFADAYSSWQRGSNENGNGLLREFFPKKTNFDHVTTDELEQALNLINHRPRKCLRWKTAHETFQEELLHLI